MAESGIYEIVNLVNGKRYVGSAVNLKRRWAEHRWKLRKNRHHSVALQRAWNKYGEASFAFSTLTRCDAAEVLVCEQRFLDELQPQYNMAQTAGSLLGFRHTDEARAKISAWNTGRKLTPAHVEAIRKGKAGQSRPDMRGNQYGCRKQSTAEREINSSSKKGRPKTAAAKARIAAAAATPQMREHRSKFMKEVWARRKAALL